MEEGEGSDREGRRKREEGMQKVRCKKVRELEREGKRKSWDGERERERKRSSL